MHAGLTLTPSPLGLISGPAINRIPRRVQRTPRSCQTPEKAESSASRPGRGIRPKMNLQMAPRRRPAATRSHPARSHTLGLDFPRESARKPWTRHSDATTAECPSAKTPVPNLRAPADPVRVQGVDLPRRPSQYPDHSAHRRYVMCCIGATSRTTVSQEAE